MPYSIKHVEGDKRPWKIVKSDTGKIVGSSTSKADAEASIRARWASEKK